MSKRKLVAILGISGMVLLSSCQTKTETGALTGGAIGAATGAIIDGGGPGGILLGGAIGAVAGGLIGNSMDKESKEKLDRESPSTSRKIENNNKLSVADVIAMVRADVSNAIIMEQIEKSRSTFRLTAANIIELKDSGANDDLINFMIQTSP